METVLEIRDLSVAFGQVRAVDGVSLSVRRGEILGIIGESGSGKSTLLNAVMRLIQRPGRIEGGEILLQGRNLLRLPPGEMRRLRGKAVSMVFQDPMTALNPVFPVGEQVSEVLRVHGQARGARGAALRLLGEVGIPAPESRYWEYPHQFSGGMQQRAIIAAALACEPSLILADEPTTALDVTIQAQILNLLARINRERGTSIVLVSHDLALAAEFCHRIAVMYAGRLVEAGPAAAIFGRPRHPYTQGLLRSIPQLEGERRPLEPIPGSLPDLAALPAGCAFQDRCPHVREACLRPVPLYAVAERHQVRCVLEEENANAAPA